MNLLNKEQVATFKAIVIQAGEILLQFYTSDLKRQYKADGSFATQADIVSEIFLMKELAKLLPEAGFYTEESGLDRAHHDYVWVIDPLDGTTNFAHGIPYFCVSVALTYKDDPMLGCIYNPLTREFFYAQKGEGAWLNEVRITVSDKQEFHHSVVAVSFAESDISVLKVLWYKCGSFRTCGATALDMAYVAAGRYDGAIFTQFSWWDVAAGMLLISETGGEVVSFEGNRLVKGQKSIICGNSFLVSYAYKLIFNVNSI